MYDALTTRYTFSCPERGQARVALSSFRCACGHEHPGLVSHDDLDWAPLGLGGDASFLNLMTATVDPVEPELADFAARRIQAGEWPWSFFCYAEERPRPVFPSAFVVLAPSGRGEDVGLAVRCPVCASISINLVTAQHLDVPFHNDREVGVVEHVFALDLERAVEEFAAELYSSHFDSRRLGL